MNMTSRKPRSSAVARSWVEIYMRGGRNEPPIQWKAHMPGQPNNDLCVFFNKPHHQASTVTFFNDTTDVTSPYSVGDITLFICEEAEAIIEEMIALEDDEIIYNYAYQDERPNDQGLDDDDYGNQIDNEMGHNMPTSKYFTETHNYVVSGLIPNLDKFGYGGPDEGKCFICRKKSEDFGPDQGMKIRVPVGQMSLTDSMEIIYPPVHLCDDCVYAASLISEELIQNKQEIEVDITRDYCPSCEASYEITFSEYNRRVRNKTLGAYKNEHSVSCSECASMFYGQSRFIEFGCDTCSQSLSGDLLHPMHARAHLNNDPVEGVPTSSYMCAELGCTDICTIFNNDQNTHYPTGKPKTDEEIKALLDEKDRQNKQNQPKSSTNSDPNFKKKQLINEAKEEIGLPAGVAVQRFKVKLTHPKGWAVISRRQCTKDIDSYSWVIYQQSPKPVKKLTPCCTDINKCRNGCGCTDNLADAITTAMQAAFLDYKRTKEKNE